MRKQKLNILNVLFNFKKNGDGSPHYSNARKIIEFKIELKRLLVDIFMVSVGILSAGFGLKSFLLPNGFLDGGATGISLLISNISGINLAILLVLVNLPFVIIGYYAIGKTFAIKTAMAITGLA
ncbi:MAG: YitT family protein, partial [Ferruginibacter sp.]